MQEQFRATPSPSGDDLLHEWPYDSSDESSPHDPNDSAARRLSEEKSHPCPSESSDKLSEAAQEVYRGPLNAATDACEKYLHPADGGSDDESEGSPYQAVLSSHRLFLSRRLAPFLLESKQTLNEWPKALHLHFLDNILREYWRQRDVLDRIITSVKSRSRCYPLKTALNAMHNHIYGLVRGLPPVRDFLEVYIRPGGIAETTPFVTSTEFKTCSECDYDVVDNSANPADITDAVVKGSTIKLTVSKPRGEDPVQELGTLTAQRRSSDPAFQTAEK